MIGKLFKYIALAFYLPIGLLFVLFTWIKIITGTSTNDSTLAYWIVGISIIIFLLCWKNIIVPIISKIQNWSV